MRSAMLAVTLGTLLLGACDGDDGGAVDGDAGADAQGDGGGSGDGGLLLHGDEYATPASVDHIGCTPGSLAGFDPSGVWNLDTTTDYGGGYVEKFAGSFALHSQQLGDPPDAQTLWTAFFGGTTHEVQLSDDDVFIRVLQTSASGFRSLRVLDACTKEADGSLSGHAVYCSERNAVNGGQLCWFGTFRGVRLHRRAGEAESQGLSLLGAFSGRPNFGWPRAANMFTVQVRVKDGVGYVARLGDGLRIVDVSDPQNMRDLGAVTLSPGYNDVKLMEAAGKTYALASNDSTGIDVIDVTDPTQPQPITRFPTAEQGGGSVHTLAIEARGGKTYVYFPDGYTAGLAVYDVTDPTNPLPAGAFLHPDVEMEGGFIHDLSVQDGIVYLNYWNLGFVVVDATDPSNIVQLGQFKDYERRTSHSNYVTTIGGCKVAVHGDEDFGAHVRTIGVDPACPSTFMKQLGELSLRPEVSSHNILAFGTKAYMAYYQDGIRVLDVANPAQPTVSAYFNTWDEGFPEAGKSFFDGAIGIDVDLAAQKIYVADENRGLMVLHID